MPPPMLPLAPVTSARLPVSSNMADLVGRQPLGGRLDVLGRSDRDRLGPLGDPPGETGENLAGADLDKASRPRRRPARRSIRASAPSPVTC